MDSQLPQKFNSPDKKTAAAAPETENWKIAPEIKEIAPEAKPSVESHEPIKTAEAAKDTALESSPLSQKISDSASLPLVKSEKQVMIENVLEEDLKDVYFKMEPQLREKFKKQGEETAGKIENLLKQTKVNTKKIFNLIIDWLKLIPGVNKFFIRQEAKIKTDRIIKLK